jgi:hypothetical protein
MASTVRDIFRWNKALLEQRVLSAAASTRAMFSDAACVDPLTYYGIGWFVSRLHCAQRVARSSDDVNVMRDWRR